MEPDVERRFERLEALLESNFQKSELRFQKAEARMDRAEARMDKAEARSEARSEKLEARFEKRMKGFEKLAEIGMKEIAHLRRMHRETDEKMNALIDAQQGTEAAIKELAAAQKLTAASLQRFLDSLGKTTNGH